MRELQELFYYKLKDTPFRVWHYYVLLTVLYVAIPLLPQTWFDTPLGLGVLFAYLLGSSVMTNAVEKHLSRNGVDSILIRRYFATIPWVLMSISSAIILQLGHFSGFIHDWYGFFFWLGAGLSVFHILGIIVHYKKRKLTYRNIKKEDLFQ